MFINLLGGYRCGCGEEGGGKKVATGSEEMRLDDEEGMFW